MEIDNHTDSGVGAVESLDVALDGRDLGGELVVS